MEADQTASQGSTTEPRLGESRPTKATRHLTSRPWWGLDTLRERVAALRASMEPELAAKRPPDTDPTGRAVIAARQGVIVNGNREAVVPPFKPQRHGYHHKVLRKYGSKSKL